jgi:glycosyltransferase involved in cell wall biosynthesis
MSIPQISVIVPAYNVEQYIAATLCSLQTQSHRDFEALVVDDGSTDNTAEIVRSFTSRDSRFKLFSKPNGGLSSARNYGICQARGEYIALLDGDDLYGREKLATHLWSLSRDSKIGVVYSASRAIREDGSLTPIKLSGRPVALDPLAALLCKNFIGHGSNAVFRRCIFDEIGGFDETLHSCEDVDYWLRIAATKKWHFYREPEVHSFYRVRPSGLSFDLAEMERSRKLVIAKAQERSPELVQPLLSTAHAYLNRYLARLALTSGNADAAKKYIALALRCDRRIFLRDPRSLLTLTAIQLMPVAKIFIGRTLGWAKATN